MRTTPFMKLISAWVLMAGVALVFTGCARSLKAQPSSGQPAKKQPLVEVHRVALTDITATYETVGTVMPLSEIKVLPKVEQRILSLPLEEGDRVMAGQVIARLDASEVEAQLRQADAEYRVAQAKLTDLLSGSRAQDIRAAEATLRQAQAGEVQARKNRAHLDKLYAASGIPQQQLDEAQGKWEVAQAQVATAETNVEDARRDLDRLQELLKIGGISQEEEDRARTRYHLAVTQRKAAQSVEKSAGQALAHIRELNVGIIPRQQLDDAQQKVAMAQAAVAAARERLSLLREGPAMTQVAVFKEQVKQAGDKMQYWRVQQSYCTLRAPISGVITKKYLDQGDMAQTKSPIVSIADTARLLIRAGVPDKEAARITPGKSVRVRFDAVPNKSFTSRVSRVYPSTEADTKLVPVEIVFPANAPGIQPGGFVRLALEIEKHKKAIVIPSDAIMQRPNGDNIVFVLEDNKARIRAIETGIEQGLSAEVASGLQAGEQLIIHGQEMLKDGVEVKVKPPKGQGKKGATGGMQASPAAKRSMGGGGQP